MQVMAGRRARNWFSLFDLKQTRLQEFNLPYEHFLFRHSSDVVKAEQQRQSIEGIPTNKLNVQLEVELGSTGITATMATQKSLYEPAKVHHERQSNLS